MKSHNADPTYVDKKMLLIAVMSVAFHSYAATSHNSSLHIKPFSVATYNAKFLSSCMTKGREANFLIVAAKLANVDVVALQEVRDRLAVEHYFKPSDWTVIIDDDSTDDMNLAFAVRRGVRFRLNSGTTTNADEVLDFVFTNKNDNFVDARRVLKLYIETDIGEVLLLNHHAKSRYSGRASSEVQRVGAALDIVEFVNAQSNPNIVLLGDFNDTPDDASSNTLEMGYEAIRQIENVPDPFLINLTETLAARDIVSYGLKSNALTGDYFKKVDSVVVGSRQTNLDNYITDTINSHGLYDQIYISPAIDSAFSSKWLIRTFEHPSAIDGNNDTRASDHLPVIATLGLTEIPKPHIKITALLPNPVGTDSKNETITLKSIGSAYEGGLLLKDASGKATPIDVQISKDTSLS
ncbi:hypothetical protein CAG54_04780 [Vibrio sp. V27_P1S3P104]|uniref:endonuclease/exonuclease/phosphatase family protein n=1 Tax=unclassified Vibrio TaxID=2614977 RepID=UPI0013725381|nr:MULTISPECIES: endonuclease/exonuclease/phosphatase family protein [unclassified Vibrio]NAW68182.1 hypothetical protein [Vibrio sp. V28_P6S34P95]NAX04148.1 hypothetical protein [Vibrio sp. V30_P3S12P165]NAX35628.1 hypothetical protein [Vibrio sp. V29_P1S30P107]NAX36836.1 hypothetical protein [Vibrio sp. V27_P1S3P104]